MKKYIVFIVVCLFFIIFLIIPLGALFLSGILGEPVNLFRSSISGIIHNLMNTFSIKNIVEIITNQRYIEGFVNSFLLSFVVTLVDIIIGIILAFAITRVHIPFKKFFHALIFLPFILPTFMGALGFIIVFGKSGIITNILKMAGIHNPFFSVYSYISIALIHIFTFFPFVFVSCYSMLHKIGSSTVNEQAKVMGATHVFSTFTVNLPLIRPGIARGALLTFIASFSDFGAPMILLPAKGNLAILNVYRGLLGMPAHWGDVTLLSVIMLAIIAFISLLLGKYIIGKRDYQIQVRSTQGAFITNKPIVMIVLILCILFLIVPVINLCSIILMSFTGSWGTEFIPHNYTLKNFISIFTSSPRPVINSYLLSLCTLFIAIPWSLFIAYFTQKNKIMGKYIIYPLSLLPFAIPGVILSIAFILVFNTPPLLLHNTMLILLLAYVLKKSAFSIQTNKATLFQLKTSLVESSSVLGATKLFTFVKIIFPFLSPGIMAGAILIYISTMHDLSNTVLLSAPQWTPLSLYIFREIEAGRIFLSCSYCVVLILLIIIPVFLTFIIIRKNSISTKVPLF